MTSSADVGSRALGRSRSTSTTRSPTGATGIERAAAAVGDPGILERVRAETWVRRDGVVVDRHHWRVLHEPETFMPPSFVEPFLAALDPPLFADAIPALEALRGRVTLALLTNNPFGAQVLDAARLARRRVRRVVVADPGSASPNPRAFAPLVDALGRRADARSRTWATASSPTSRARAARGCTAVWLDRWNDPWPLPAGVAPRSDYALRSCDCMLTVGFDLDMTLVDSPPWDPRQHGALAHETGVPIDVDVVIDRLGPKLEWELGQWFPAEQVAHTCKRYRAHYWDHCVGDGTHLVAGRARGGRRGARRATAGSSS